jgi:hypothetical protein
MRTLAVGRLRRFRWAATCVGLLGIASGCATDDSGHEPRGEAILRVHVSAQTSGMPVPAATVRLFADYVRGCTEQGPLTAELLTGDDGALRVQAEGVLVPGGTCFSLWVLPPPETALRAVERVPFLLEFRPAPPLDSVLVDVTLEPAT